MRVGQPLSAGLFLRYSFLRKIEKKQTKRSVALSHLQVVALGRKIRVSLNNKSEEEKMEETRENSVFFADRRLGPFFPLLLVCFARLAREDDWNHHRCAITGTNIIIIMIEE